jgi:hypothetical protein
LKRQYLQCNKILLKQCKWRIEYNRYTQSLLCLKGQGRTTLALLLTYLQSSPGLTAPRGQPIQSHCVYTALFSIGVRMAQIEYICHYVFIIDVQTHLLFFPAQNQVYFVRLICLVFYVREVIQIYLKLFVIAHSEKYCSVFPFPASCEA